MSDLKLCIIQEERSETLALQENNLLTKLDERRLQEKIIWKKKSRIRWLKEGEKNTKFFHRSTIQRRMHNHITILNNSQGDKLEYHENIEK